MISHASLYPEVEILSHANPMLKPRITKVTVNTCVGKSGEQLEKALKILESITNGKPCICRAKRTIRDFNIHKGEPIAAKVTLRGSKAMEFLKRVLDAVGYRIPSSRFNEYGNFSIGLKSHLDLPNTTYDPALGIIGMDVCVNLERPRYRVARKKWKRSSIGKKHRLTKEESIAFVKETLGVEVL
ncbi:MAG: 50S ribosomal protein L5 [Candidatus Bathyarchaeia archaeon]